MASSLVSQNTSGNNGGGIFSSGTLTLTTSTVYSNTANHAGGISIANGGLLWMTGSTVYANTVAPSGGGIGNSGSWFGFNSTLSGNRANFYGGGVSNAGGFSLFNVTIAYNRADADGNNSGDGGRIYGGGIEANLRNSLLAANFRGTGSMLDDCEGSLASYGAMRVSTAPPGCSISDPMDLVTPASLGPLANNGGPTWTVGLLPGSEAIDAGDPVSGCVNQLSQPLAIDQRGGARVVGVRCDVGAFEFGAIVPSV